MVDRTVLVRLKAEVNSFVAGMGTARAAVKGVTSEIDTTNDRVAWLSQSILGVGPALIPLGAAAAPIFSGIATQATVATAAVGVMALAFVGVGDAMKAVNDYQAKPTIENFDKMSESLQKLGPDGAHFVAFLDELTPQLHSLQLISREGILPGAEEGLSSLLELMPRLKGMVSDIAGALGQLMSEAGQGISGEGLEAFFDFLDRNARPILLDLGHAVGNFASGFLNMLVGFEPLTQQFSGGLLEMSKSFKVWSAGLNENAGFQDFISYVQDSIPRAMDFLASLADAFAAIVVAAAPVGDVMLPLLSELLSIIAALANSPLGPIFISAAAAMSIYGRAVALASVTTGGLISSVLGANSAFGSQVSALRAMPGVFAEYAAAQDALTVAESRYQSAAAQYNGTLKASNKIRADGYKLSAEGEGRLADALGKVQMASYDVQEATTRANKAEGERTRVMRSSAGAAGRTAALVAGLAIATSETGQSMDLANTASFALMGAMVGGGVGAVAGGLVGATMDLSKAAGKAGESQKQLSQDIRTAGNDMTAYGAAVDGAFTRLQDHVDDISSSNFGEVLANAFDPDVIAAFTTDAFGGTTVEDKMAKDAAAAEEKYGDLQLAASLLAGQMNLLGEDSSASLEEMTAALNGAQPAMAGLGVTTDDLVAAVRDGSIMGLVEDLKAWQTNADSTAGRTDEVIDSVTQLDNELNSTASSASQLAQALDALFSPKLNLSEALDNWTKSVRTLDKDLSHSSKSLEGNSKAALMNRDAIRGRVGDMIDVLKAEADAGGSAQRLTARLASQRQALLDAGAAAGISRKQMRTYLDQLGLTPKLVNTLIQNNAKGAKGDVDALNNSLNALDGKVVRAIVQVIRRTSNQAGAALDGMNFASGGLVTGAGGPRDDRIPAMLSNREYVIQAAAVAKYGVGLFEKYNRMRFADGGLATNTYVRTRGDDAPTGASEGHHAAAGLHAVFVQGNLLGKSLKALKRALDDAEKTVTKEKNARDAVLDKMSSLGGAVAGGLRSDIFATPTNPWAAGAGGGANSILDADIARASEVEQLIKTLEGKGLKGSALAELLSKDDVGLMRAYAAMSADDLAAYTQKFDRREQALGAVSAAAGNAAYGGELGAAQAELRQANRELRAIRDAVKAMDKKNEKGHKKTAEEAGKGAGAPAAARRRARRP